MQFLISHKEFAMKKIIGVMLVGVCVLLVGCGPSAQEKAVEQQQKDKQKIMGDGNQKFTPGESVGGL